MINKDKLLKTLTYLGLSFVNNLSGWSIEIFMPKFFKYSNIFLSQSSALFMRQTPLTRLGRGLILSYFFNLKKKGANLIISLDAYSSNLDFRGEISTLMHHKNVPLFRISGSFAGRNHFEY